jgi:hypothetical protein
MRHLLKVLSSALIANRPFYLLANLRYAPSERDQPLIKVGRARMWGIAGPAPGKEWYLVGLVTHLISGARLLPTCDTVLDQLASSH